MAGDVDDVDPNDIIDGTGTCSVDATGKKNHDDCRFHECREVNACEGLISLGAPTTINPGQTELTFDPLQPDQFFSTLVATENWGLTLGNVVATNDTATRRQLTEEDARTEIYLDGQVQSLVLSLLFSYSLFCLRIHLPHCDLPFLITRCNISYFPFSSLVTYSLITYVLLL